MDILQAIYKLDRLVFTTREVAAVTGKSLSAVTQALRRLESKSIITHVIRGVWAFAGDRRFGPLMVVPYLNSLHRSYISFISAMHIYGMIGQIPQVVTVASTAHTKKVKTPVGVFSIHQISPSFFDGFVWNKNGSFLIATPEKALVDCLYLASRRGKRYLSFPELEFPRSFRKSVAKRWVTKIEYPRLRKSVMRKLTDILK